VTESISGKTPETRAGGTFLPQGPPELQEKPKAKDENQGKGDAMAQGKPDPRRNEPDRRGISGVAPDLLIEPQKKR